MGAVLSFVKTCLSQTNKRLEPTKKPALIVSSTSGSSSSSSSSSSSPSSSLSSNSFSSSSSCSQSSTLPLIIPESVNYHFTRSCNYQCKFCFHTAKTSDHLNLTTAKHGLQLLKLEGMKKINFSGGEPFLYPDHLGEMVRYCKQDLSLESVSIVSNGSKIKEHWMKKYGKYLDILAVSCDSFDAETLYLIGRGTGKSSRNHIEQMRLIRSWCDQYHVAFKINTVVNIHNWSENMTIEINELNPVRWKVFQCLLIDGENVGEQARRDATQLVISDHQWKEFLSRHASVTSLVPESNEAMRDSYLILDERMRFLDCREGKKIPSKSLLDVGVQGALAGSGFDEKMFFKRGGKYVWSKDKLLEW